MHNLYRTTLLAALFVSLLAGSAVHASVVGTGDKFAMSERLSVEIGRAGQSYRTRQQFAGLYERAAAQAKVLEEQRRTILDYQQSLRDERDALRSVWASIQKSGMTAEVAAHAPTVRRAQQAAVVQLARELQRDDMRTSPLLAALGGDDAVQRMQWIRGISKSTDATQVAGAVFAALTLTEERLTASRNALLTLNDDIAKTQRDIASAEDGLISVRAITQDVHDQILLLQSALARIDAQLRSKSERELIELGLLDVSPGRAHAAPPAVQWPVDGPISAGFRNQSYLAHFGVPHLGTDIAVPQGSVVRSAAEGVVFLVRDGGERGYSYILIGHKDGLATLYGHLFSFSVTAGQRVTAGQEIGRSGGTPGTYGAGPMTSGAHLHFEVIHNGENVDPLDVLPAR